jgi:hypothetical protein
VHTLAKDAEALLRALTNDVMRASSDWTRRTEAARHAKLSPLPPGCCNAQRNNENHSCNSTCNEDHHLKDAFVCARLIQAASTPQNSASAAGQTVHSWCAWNSPRVRAEIDAVVEPLPPQSLDACAHDEQDVLHRCAVQDMAVPLSPQGIWLSSETHLDYEL